MVILIDEYDKPLFDNIENSVYLRELREGLQELYSAIKDLDSYIEFAFLTGVSKFSKEFLFSGLNNIEEISLDENYGNIYGFTQEEIETTLLPYLKGVDLIKLKEWCNGYNFLKDGIYNPFDILSFISKGHKYINYRFETGVPTFLLKQLKEGDYYIPELENFKADEKLLNEFDLENIRLEILLFQRGYLSIKKVQTDPLGFLLFDLNVPNLELKRAFNTIIIETLTHDKAYLTKQQNLINALKHQNFTEIKETLQALFSSIVYEKNYEPYERYYSSIVYAYFASLGIDMVGEDVRNKERVDMSISLDNTIYIIEFKVGEEDALSYIKTKKHHEKYQSQEKELFLIGINFNKKERKISHFQWGRG